MKAGLMKVETDRKISSKRPKRKIRKKVYIPRVHSTLFGGKMVFISSSNLNSRTKKNFTILKLLELFRYLV